MLCLPIKKKEKKRKNHVVVKLKIVAIKKIIENYFLKDKYDLMKQTSHKINKEELMKWTSHKPVSLISMGAKCW